MQSEGCGLRQTRRPQPPGTSRRPHAAQPLNQETGAGPQPSSRLRQVGIQPQNAHSTFTFGHGDVEHARKIAAVMIGHRAIRSRFRCVPNWSLREQKRVATGPVRGYPGVAARVFTQSS